jgi:chromosomal replication initiator protein
MDAHTLWKTIAEDLQVSLSPVQYNGWIRPLTITKTTGVGEDRLILDVEVPSTFHQNMVEQRFYGQLKEAADRISDKETEIRFSINPELAHKAGNKPPGPLFEHQQVDEAAFFIQKHGLREDFNFANFAVSSSNEMAYAAAKAVADTIGSAYNPLFLYGGVGVGKPISCKRLPLIF